MLHSWQQGLLVFASLLIHGSTAYDMRAVDVSNSSYFQELHQSGRLIVDESHIARSLQLASEEPYPSIAARSDDGATPTSTTSATGKLPSPFDTNIGSNFTQTSCSAFFSTFLNNGTFQSCVPISLLLQNSLSFFDAARSLSTLDNTIKASCSVSLEVCLPIMSHFATEIVSDNNCGADYQLQNPIVTQARAGFAAYEPVYKASCLKDNSTGQYCFAEALTNTNASASADSYAYYTAIGISLPNQGNATCNSCLKQTMQIFSDYAGDSDQPLASTYLHCAAMINQACGTTFATTDIKAQSQTQSSDGGSSMRSWSGLAVLVAMSATLLLQS